MGMIMILEKYQNNCDTKIILLNKKLYTRLELHQALKITEAESENTLK